MQSFALIGLVVLLATASAKGAAVDSPKQGIPLPSGSATPAWPKPSVVELPPGALSIRSGGIELVHSLDVLGGFEVRVNGKAMAIGQNRPILGYVRGGEFRWLDLAEAGKRKIVARRERGALLVEFQCVDADGGKWSINQRFAPGHIDSTLDVRNEIICDQERSVAFLPMFMLFAGTGSFGSVKGQGLLAGLEYLENEPSSSEADVIGPA